MGQSILQRVAGGDRGAMDECVDRYGRLVRAIAARVFGQLADVDDAVQEAFAAIWMNASRFDGMRGSEHGFVAMIARQRAIDHLRRSRRASRLGYGTEPIEWFENEPPVDPEETRQEMGPVEVAFDHLSSDQQRVVRLALMHGLTREQIARHVGCPVNTVKSHFRRGLNRLRDQLCVAPG
ncbi:MAG: RNA polymerase sigma factor [Planctomycetes bacterium]|nr:RNA polymerase sigma factor [Planctomycetota bacterium]